MILTIEDIKNILLNNPSKDTIAKGQEVNKKLRMHFYGEGLKDEITLIKGYEKKEINDVRKNYARSNKDIFSRWFRPVDKVFSAPGGSVYFNLTEEGNKTAMIISANIKDGMSVRKWVENKWLAHLKDDPNGIIFMELPAESNEAGQLIPYPTYKSINSIYAFQPSGNMFDWIVFHVTASEKKSRGIDTSWKIYRVVDDENDYWVKVDGETVSILTEHSYLNFFGKVPAIRNSDLIDPENDLLMLSPASDVIELADDFLKTGSIRNLTKIRHAFPKYWEYASDCIDCKGEGTKDGETCKTCNGTGKKIMSNPGDMKMLPVPTDKEYPIIAPNVAGYVAFPTDYFDYSTTELQALENIGYATLWGASSQVKTTGPSTQQGDVQETATGALLDLQPIQNRLQVYSEMAERRHKFIVDCIIQIAIQDDYKGASVNYGRRYMLESPDAIWDRYSNARVKGAAISILDDLLIEFIETKYNSDPVAMNIQMKLLGVEPFIHFTVKDVQAMNVAEEDYKAKLYFSEWLSSMNDSQLLQMNVQKLRENLLAYTSAKVLPAPEVKPAF